MNSQTQLDLNLNGSKQKYTPRPGAQKALKRLNAFLKKNKMPIRVATRELGIPYSTLWHWQKGESVTLTMKNEKLIYAALLKYNLKHAPAKEKPVTTLPLPDNRYTATVPTLTIIPTPDTVLRTPSVQEQLEGNLQQLDNYRAENKRLEAIIKEQAAVIAMYRNGGL